MNTPLYDVHTHHVFPEYYNVVKDSGRMAEDGFPMPDDYSIENNLAFMDEAGIAWSLLSLASPQPYYGDDKVTIRLARTLNEKTAEIKHTRPDRFGFSAFLPHPNLDAAVEEAIFALDVLGADAVKLASNSRGLYIGDPSMEPLFEELNKRKAVITMHPHRPEPQKEGVFSAGPIPLFEFICDTTRAMLNVIGNGILVRYPDLKFVVPHCGSFLPVIYDRMILIVGLLVEAGRMEPIDVPENFKKLYFDCSGDPDPLLPLLLRCTEPSRIMFGSDYPFTNRKVANKKTAYLREYLHDNKELAPYADMIYAENAKKLFRLP